MTVLALVACGQTEVRSIGGPDAGGDDVEVVLPPEEGRWERCCYDGVEDQCWCPNGVSCNYAWSCYDFGTGEPDANLPDVDQRDAGAPDAGGRWERCCYDGVEDLCWCPDGISCNYAWTCSFPDVGIDGG